MSDGGFLARWSRRKAGIPAPVDERRDVAAPAAPAATPSVAPETAVVPPSVVSGEPAPVADAPPLPTLADVAALTRDSDYARFMAPGVDLSVRNAAMKKLFSDPHFNVMDGLDTYIDDYGKPDPIPLAMLRRLHQSRVLGLFDAETEQDGARAGASSDGGAAEAVAESEPSIRPVAISGPPVRPDDDPDLRLQQDDGAERAGPAPGARS